MSLLTRHLEAAGAAIPPCDIRVDSVGSSPRECSTGLASPEHLDAQADIESTEDAEGAATSACDFGTDSACPVGR
eukprot:6055981-Karenia_brevis.AAC.1